MCVCVFTLNYVTSLLIYHFYSISSSGGIGGGTKFWISFHVNSRNCSILKLNSSYESPNGSAGKFHVSTWTDIYVFYRPVRRLHQRIRWRRDVSMLELRWFVCLDQFLTFWSGDQLHRMFDLEILVGNLSILVHRIVLRILWRHQLVLSRALVFHIFWIYIRPGWYCCHLE